MTVIETMVAFVTLNGTEAVIEPRVAVIIVPPGARPDTTPPDVMEANAGLDEDQITLEVRLCVLPSLKVPVAVN